MEAPKQLEIDVVARIKEAVLVIGPVLPGSIILVNEGPWDDLVYTDGDSVAEDAEDVSMRDLLHQIERAVGHKQFLVMSVPEGMGSISVHGPDEVVAMWKRAFEQMVFSAE
jgi:hypothetical protein